MYSELLDKTQTVLRAIEYVLLNPNDKPGLNKVSIETTLEDIEKNFDPKQLMKSIANDSRLSGDKYTEYEMLIKLVPGRIRAIRKILTQMAPVSSPTPPPAMPMMASSSSISLPEPVLIPSSSKTPDQFMPETLISTLPASSEHIMAKDDLDCDILKTGFEILSRENHAADWAAFLNEEEDVAVTAIDQYGQSLLHYAIHLGRPESAEKLIKGGASLGASTATGLQALHIAAARGNVKCLDKLLNRGALARENLVTISLQGEPVQINALHVAILFGHRDAISYLFGIYSKTYLLKSGLLFLPDGSYTVLHLPVFANRPDTLAWLLNHPVIQTQGCFDHSCKTVLHLAKHSGYADCVDILQPSTSQTASSSSAAPTTSSSSYRTPFIRVEEDALHINENGYNTLVDLLISHGTDGVSVSSFSIFNNTARVQMPQHEPSSYGPGN